MLLAGTCRYDMKIFLPRGYITLIVIKPLINVEAELIISHHRVILTHTNWAN